MINFKQIILVVIFSTLSINKSVSLMCYKCNGSSRNADKPDEKSCLNGYSTMIPHQQCPDDHNFVCSTYQYEIVIYGLLRSRLAMRGCQSIHRLDDCDDLYNDVKNLVRPAKVRQIDCYACRTDLCNLQ